MNIVIETPRLMLREFLEADAPHMFALNNDADVIRYTGDPPFDSTDHAKLFIQQYDKYNVSGMGRWTMIRRDNNQYLGWCGLNRNSTTNETDLGFRLLQREWNKGFATEAARACIRYGFEALALQEIIGRAMQQNAASIRVLEKAGMTFEKYFDAHGNTCVQYHITKATYAEQQS